VGKIDYERYSVEYFANRKKKAEKLNLLNNGKFVQFN